MSELNLTRSRRATPLGLLGMLGLVFAIEHGLARNELAFKHYFTHDWIVTARAARQKTKGCDILCFGDSQVKFGVAPSVLEERLGQRAFNLAVCGGQAPSSYFLLRRALDAGARPEAIVVDFMPHLLAHGPRRNDRQWPDFVNAFEFVDMLRTTHNASFMSSLATAWLTPSWKSRFEIRECVLAALRGERVARPEELNEYERLWETHQGAMLGSTAPQSPKKYNLSRWEDFPKAWSCHPVNAAYVRRFLALAESRGIRVFWLMPPVNPEAQARRESLGIDERYVPFVRKLQATFANLTVVDARHAASGSAVFLDPHHLDTHGATALSESLAELIAEARSNEGGGRWVSLPTPRTFASDFPPEVAGPSKLALQAQDREAR